MKKLFCVLLALLVLPISAAAEYDMPSDTEDVPASVFEEGAVPTTAENLDIAAPCAILIERETGEVIFEKNADERCRPASVTKVMTMLLIAEAVDRGDISLDDTVITSAAAAGMGGSQVFLKEGETMSLREMFKCIVVSSANDAAVAVAEHIAGSEAAFAALMNRRAEELGLSGTNFTNCTGLYDDDNHLTTCRDIAVMSAELLSHDWVREYTTIWTDTIRGGEFGLSNTNKLIRFYDGATGLKTGYTSQAGHCLSASAERDGVEYIAVVLKCASSAERFESAKELLSFAFSNYTRYDLTLPEVLPPVAVTLGKSPFVSVTVPVGESMLIRKADTGAVECDIQLVGEIHAPVEEGQQLGTVTYRLRGAVVAELPISASAAVGQKTWWDIFRELLSTMW